MGINRDWAKIMCGSMVAALGAALIVFAVLSAFATFGAATPLAIPAIAIGGGLISAALKLASLTTFIVVMSFIGGGYARRGVKGELMESGENVQEVAVAEKAAARRRL